METAELYSLAAKNGVEALSKLTKSKHFFKGEETFTRENLTKAYGTDLFFLGGGTNDEIIH